MADIYISTLDRKSVYQFPTLPEEFPTLSQLSKNEEFNSFNNGDYNLLNGSGLITFSMSQMLPMKEYSFLKADYHNSANIINLMLTSMVEKFPVRFVLKGNNDDDYINLAVTVEKFDYNFNKSLDVVFTADFKQYRAIV